MEISKDFSIINVLEFGAKGDGVTDDSSPIQGALNAVRDAGGGTVYFPSGTYVVSSLVAYANTTMFGESWTSILKQKSGAQYCVSVNPGSGGSPSVAGNASNIRFDGIQMLGTVAVDAFSEQFHLLNLNAVSDVMINNCLFKGWRGDAIYIGSSNVAGTERHNRQIRITGCTFDGVNRDNRNAITAIDCDGLVITHCNFSNCTRPDMPGAIDLEPNANAFHTLRNIVITHNKFENIGGNVAVISLYLPVAQASSTTPSQNFIIEENVISGVLNGDAVNRSGGIHLRCVQDAADTDVPHNILVKGNIVGQTNRSFSVFGIKGVKLEGNIFDTSRQSSLVSYTGVDKCQDVELIGNTFRELSQNDGTGVGIFDVDRITIRGNMFDNNGRADGTFGYALDFNNGTTTYVRIEDNLFRGIRTIAAIQKEAGSTTTPHTNRVTGNVFLDDNRVFLQTGTLKDRRQENSMTALPADAAYTWAVGDRVWNSNPVEAGAAASKYIVLGWVCVTAGSPGAWLPMRVFTGN